MPLLEVITVGIPFCVFKLLTGLWLMDGGPAARFAGYALFALGALDLVINTVNLVSLALRRRRALEPCLFAMVASALRPRRDPAWTWQDVGNSLDVLLAMSIVAYMIAVQAQASFPEARRYLWNSCVILDVMGAGLTRFGGSLRRISVGITDRRAA